MIYKLNDLRKMYPLMTWSSNGKDTYLGRLKGVDRSIFKIDYSTNHHLMEMFFNYQNWYIRDDRGVRTTNDIEVVNNAYKINARLKNFK